eukprot:Stramenopile-MAST_4_protein_4299
MSAFMLNLDVSATSGNGAPAAFVPLSTPRRRLAAALDMEKKICAKLEQQGWHLVLRQGKKIGAVYALVTAYAKFPDVRLAIYQTNNCQIQEVLFCSETDLSLVNQQVAKKRINAELAKYTFDEIGRLIKKPVDISGKGASRAAQVLSTAEAYTAVLQQTKKLNLQTGLPNKSDAALFGGNSARSSQ